MPKRFLIFSALLVFILSACTNNSLEAQSGEDWSEVREPYSDFEPYIRDENEKGTEDNPYKIGEKALAKVGYWGSDLEKHEAFLEIEIDSILTGDEAEDPESEVPDNTQRVLALTNVEMIEGPENEAYSISLQPVVYDEEYYIGQELGLVPFYDEEPVTLGESRMATMEILAPQGHLKGKPFILDTGLDQVWFEF